ncbi:hypothetical protein ACTQ41_06255 [Bacillota bacterium LCP21S3_D8]
MKTEEKAIISYKVFIYLILFISFYQPIIFKLKPTFYIPILACILLIVSKIKMGYLVPLWRTRTGYFIKGIIIIELYLYITIFRTRGDESILIQPVHLLFGALLVWGIRNYRLAFKVEDNEFENVIINTGLFQSFVCILMCIFLPLRGINWSYLLSTLVNPLERQRFEAIDVYRFYGIAGPNQYLSAIGTVSALLFLLAVFRAVSDKLDVKMIIKAIFLLVPALLDSRTGVLCATFGVTVLLFFCYCNKKASHFMVITLWGGIICSILLGSLVVQNRFFHKFYVKPIDTQVASGVSGDGIEEVTDSKAASYSMDHWSSSVLSATVSLATGDTSSKTYEWYGGLLPFNWDIPNGYGLWIGEGKVVEKQVQPGEIVGRTDAGYARLICVGGIFLTFLSLAVLIYVEGTHVCPDAHPLSIAVIMCFLLAEFKGSVYLQVPVVILLLLIADIFFDRLQEDKCENEELL